jgi:hypothetical protein
MSHDAHSHGHDAHGHDSHGAPHDGGHGDDGQLQAAPNPPPRGAQDSPNRAVPSPTPSHGREALRGGDGILRPISESEYFAATPEAEAIVSSHIDEYFNQPLDIFPFWETDGKPDRFHVLFSRQIEERFPVDADIRSRIHGYGRRVFKALVTHVTVKRLSQAGALLAFAALAILGPGWDALRKAESREEALKAINSAGKTAVDSAILHKKGGLDAAEIALRVAESTDKGLAPSMRAKASRLPPLSTIAMHCGTPIASALATASASILLAPA